MLCQHSCHDYSENRSAPSRPAHIRRTGPRQFLTDRVRSIFSGSKTQTWTLSLSLLEFSFMPLSADHTLLTNAIDMT